MPMPPEPLIQLPTSSLHLVEAISLIQEHTSIPIVMPEELTSGEVRDILTTAQLLQDGVLHSTWTTGAVVLRPEAPDDALDVIGPDGALYVADWYDGQVAHLRSAEGAFDKTNGRIYRLQAKGAAPRKAE